MRSGMDGRASRLRVEGSKAQGTIWLFLDDTRFGLDRGSALLLADELYKRAGRGVDYKRLFRPRPCSACGRLMVRAQASSGTGLAHQGKGLCRTCHMAWLRAGRPEPVADFRHSPRPSPKAAERAVKQAFLVDDNPLPEPTPTHAMMDGQAGLGLVDVLKHGAWHSQAACLGMDTDVFFSENPAVRAHALRICSVCPVVGECLKEADAVEHEPFFGVRGGLTAADRRRRYQERMTSEEES